MRITELLTESQQLDEGPILNKIGAGIGKAAGTVAKGVGAVAGGIAGLGSAAKKGFQAGKSQVAQAGDEPTTPTLTQAPAKTAVKKTAAPATTTPPAKTGFKSAFNKAYAAGQDYAKARDAADAAGTPLPKQGILDKATRAIKAGTAPDQPAQDQTPAKVPSQYAQIKASIDKLTPSGKKQILQFLQKSVGGTSPTTNTTQPAAEPTTAAPADNAPINPSTGKPLTDKERQAHQDAGGQFDGETGAPLPLGQQATNANPPADDFEKKVADLKAKRDAEKAAAAKTTPAATTNTAPPADDSGVGQAAIAAAKAGQDPAAAAKAAMAANNPNLAKLMQQSGDMPSTTKPHTGGKVAGQVSQTPNAVRKRAARAAAKSAAMPAESVTESYVSIFRKV